MKYKDLKGILPNDTWINLFVDNMYYAFLPYNTEQFKQFKNCDIIRIVPINIHELTMEISTLDLET